jgi:DNA-binding response OmpR family regulator
MGNTNNRKRILVVEDDADLRELLRAYFRAAGFAVATASNGIDALTKTRSVAPNLVLLDLILPELDGFAVCEALRRSPELATVPIIIMTGLASELARLAVLESGANDFVLKPITPSELVTRMRHWLRHPPEASAPLPMPLSPSASRLLTRVE